MSTRRGERATMPSTDPIDELRERLREFAAARDWQQFHTPKNLAMALSVEAAELLEHFQWLGDEASRTLAPPARDAVAEELADVLLYLVRLSDELSIDLIAAARAKLARNAERYPVEKARGSSRKYTEL
jgi:dCTP diphosphatase